MNESNICTDTEGKPISRTEIMDSLRELLSEAYKYERQLDPCFRRWPDLERVIEHIEKHGLPPAE